MYAKAVHVYEREGMTLWESPKGDDFASINMEKTHRFHSGGTICSSSFTCTGDITTTGGTIYAAENIYAQKNIWALGQLAHYGGINVLPLNLIKPDPKLGEKITAVMTKRTEIIDSIREGGSQVFLSDFGTLYGDSHLGNADFIQNTIGFSFNDRPDGKGKPYGYRHDKFVLPETRWQQWIKLDIAKSDAKGWKENFVQYQGSDSYPWPGKKQWKDDKTFKHYKSLEIFDPETTTAVDRDNMPWLPKWQYTKAALAERIEDTSDILYTPWREFVPDENYILLGGEE